jgi:hypothetical protein
MTIWHDLGDAARQLRRRPGFTAAAVVSLALLQWEGEQARITMFGDTMSYPAYRDIRDRNDVFSGVMCRYPLPLSVGYEGGRRRSP